MKGFIIMKTFITIVIVIFAIVAILAILGFCAGKSYGKLPG